MFCFGIYFSFQYFLKFEGVIQDAYSKFFFDLAFPDYEVTDEEDTDSSLVKDKEKEPVVYLYNSHPTEEYGNNPLYPSVTVTTVNHIIETKLQQNNCPTISEDKSVATILKENNWNYASSYRASRILMEEAKKKYSSLSYFIDVHRDSLDKKRTTVLIEDKSYASLLFLIGLENPNYSLNYEFTDRIKKKLDEKYPGLCKGIMQKGGIGVNGVYNQDFSPYTILIEVGGEENTVSEITNSALAFSECFLEVYYEG
ncbi:MAG: stage II sporulation protein P [Bacilli bacterium]|nr:stage II sporulation protein P [Bacilli bacterium]